MAKIRLGLCSALSLLTYIGQIFGRLLASKCIVDSRKVAVFIKIILMRMTTWSNIFDQHFLEIW